MKYNYVLFHNPCLDGFLSFVLLREANLLEKNCFIRGVAADIKTVPPNVGKKDIIIVDLNLNPMILMEILKVARSVLFIDHHPSEIHKIKHPKLTIIYDNTNTKSASRIVWEKYVKGKKKKIPDLIKYVSDNDLMANEYDDTTYYITAYDVHYNEQNGIKPNQFHEKADKIVPLINDNKQTKKLIKLGKYYSVYKHVITKKSLNNFEGVDLKTPFNKKWVLAVTNVGGFCAKLVASQLQQFDDFDCCMVWYYNVSTKGIICSCRSKKNDIRWLARLYGGDGHKNAVTFRFNATNVYDWLKFHNNKY